MTFPRLILVTILNGSYSRLFIPTTVQFISTLDLPSPYPRYHLKWQLFSSLHPTHSTNPPTNYSNENLPLSSHRQVSIHPSLLPPGISSTQFMASSRSAHHSMPSIARFSFLVPTSPEQPSPPPTRPCPPRARQRCNANPAVYSCPPLIQFKFMDLSCQSDLDGWSAGLREVGDPACLF